MYPNASMSEKRGQNSAVGPAAGMAWVMRAQLDGERLGIGEIAG